MNYLREMSVGEIFRSTFSIYFRHFSTLVLAVLPAILFLLLSEGLPKGEGGMKLFLFTFNFLATFLVTGSLVPALVTAIVSDISLGNQPSIIRAYKRLWQAHLGKLLVTALMSGTVVFLGLLLFAIPGMIAFIQFIFVSVIVMLEGSWAKHALRRSQSLVKGNAWRIFGFYFVAIGSLILFLCLAFGILAYGMDLEHASGSKIFAWVVGVTQILVIPLGTIPVVLFYYDLRVRKEGYDITAMAEDLKH